MRPLSGQTILITGATDGHGRGLAAESYGFDPNDLPGPDAGADTPAWLATSSDVDGVSGRFFVVRQAVDTAPHTTDARRCDRLWDESARLVGLPIGHRFSRTLRKDVNTAVQRAP